MLIGKMSDLGKALKDTESKSGQQAQGQFSEMAGSLPLAGAMHFDVLPAIIPNAMTDRHHFAKINPALLHRVSISLLLLLTSLLTGNMLVAQDLDTIRGSMTIDKQRIPFTILSKVPADEPDAQIPVIFFLHGAGERGTDNQSHLKVGLPALIQSLEALKVPCYIIYAPQCPLDQKWVDTDWTALQHTMAAQINPPLNSAFAGLDSLVIVGDRIDQNRIYITGLSMGGFAAWDLMQRHPDYFAAGIPICGGGDLAQAKQLVEIPIWAFHGKKDKLVKPSRTTDMVSAILANGGAAKMTLFDNIGHLCWDTVYKNQEVINWLIAQQLDAR